MYDAVRNIVPPFKEDEVMYPYVNEVKNYIINHQNKKSWEHFLHLF